MTIAAALLLQPAAIAFAGSGKAASNNLASQNAAAVKSDKPEDALGEIGALLEQGQTEEALVKVDAFIADQPDSDLVVAAHAVRAIVLIGLDRRDDALRAFAQADALSPESPYVPGVMLGIGMDFGAVDIAATGLSGLIERAPEEVEAVDVTRIFAILRALRSVDQDARADALMVALAGMGYGGGDISARDNLAVDAAEMELRAGRVESAARLVSRVMDRGELVRLLTNRIYAPLWPVTEARIGPRMDIAEKAAISEAKVAFDKAPDRIGARKGYMLALSSAGRFAEAVQVGTDFATTPDAMRSIDEAGGWFINEHANLLDEVGRSADADARFAAMDVLSIDEPGKGWLISMRLNRVFSLVNKGEWERALLLTDAAAAIAAKYGSPYARQMVRRLKLCALVGLGRDTTAAAAELRANKADSDLQTLLGFICRGELEAAEPLMIETLSDNPDLLIGEFQPAEVNHGGDATPWTANWANLLARPAIRAAFDKVGRVLPEAYWAEPAR